LHGKKYENQWRYRVGDYRIIAEIKYDVVKILVIEIGHRREIYR
jgi:mRNA interferase RelE/StbE